MRRWGQARTVRLLAALLAASLFAALLAGCSHEPVSPFPQVNLDFTPVISPAATSTPTPFRPLPPGAAVVFANPTLVQPDVPASSTVTATLPTIPAPLPSQLSLWVDPLLPPTLLAGLHLPSGLLPAASDNPGGASLRLEPGKGTPVSRWVYALAAPFPTQVQGVSLADLQAAWRGELAGPFAGRPMLLDKSTQAMLSAFWGPPAAGAVQVLPAAELLDAAWAQRPAWALLPFEQLEPRWKVLAVDGQSPLHKDFDPSFYPLTLTVSLTGDGTLAQAIAAQFGEQTAQPLAPATNRDPSRLTVLAMTGVTALVRATAFTMEQQGITYPGIDVSPWLREADLTHISNEVPFARDCPYPNPVQPDMRFCSDARYIGLLEDVGTDIVELTGDHFQDWGRAAMLYTLELYTARGWKYYGGGANLDEGRQALLVEHNGNRLAFIGCNAKGGGYAQAGPDQPGAVKCDLDWMAGEIARLRTDGYLPIATFQHFEYYNYKAQPDQQRDFRAMAEAGAVIVSGSQAHQPQALEFDNGALIHYGLGNLFFDQYEVSQATRQGFIDRHIFYDGRYLGTELLPILFVDYARPRPMTLDEANTVFTAVFRASGW